MKEKQTGTASLGAGVNSASGLTGFRPALAKQLRGRGQIVSVRGDRRLSRIQPVIHGAVALRHAHQRGLRPLRHAPSLHRVRREKRRGVELRVGRSSPGGWTHAHPGRYSPGGAPHRAAPGLRGRDRQHPAVHDLRGDAHARSQLGRQPVLPTRGWSTRLVGELGGEFLGGDQSYCSPRSRIERTSARSGSWCCRSPERWDSLSGLNRREEVPFWKRFRLERHLPVCATRLRRLPRRAGHQRPVHRRACHDDHDDRDAPSGRPGGFRCSRSSTPATRGRDQTRWTSRRSVVAADLCPHRRAHGGSARLRLRLRLRQDESGSGSPGWQFHFQIGGQTF